MDDGMFVSTEKYLVFFCITRQLLCELEKSKSSGKAFGHIDNFTIGLDKSSFLVNGFFLEGD